MNQLVEQVLEKMGFTLTRIERHEGPGYIASIQDETARYGHRYGSGSTPIKAATQLMANLTTKFTERGATGEVAA